MIGRRLSYKTDPRVTDVLTQKVALRVPYVLTHQGNRCIDSSQVIIKIQTAKDPRKTIEDIKKSAVRFIIFACNILASAALVLEFISPYPITRTDVFAIVCCASILLLSLILKLSMILLKFTEIQIEHGKQTERIIKILEKPSQDNHEI
jgi:hypothetical protein